jgi:uncharacterized protein (TIGR01244 family)
VTGAAEAPDPTAAIAGARRPLEGVVSAGQPTPQELERAAAAGVRTVVNLRADGEAGFEWEAEAAERLGLRYVRIPIGGPGDLTRENAERLDAALREAQGPVLVHCASGNRVGALLALREAWFAGRAPAAALAVGIDAGLTKLEAATREKLGLPPP